ncbi:MAG: hypothetical protein KIS92_13770 [Planctomycetota bacterium]|nr:hypothetical protein [Planctomycetota bacterium]
MTLLRSTYFVLVLGMLACARPAGAEDAVLSLEAAAEALTSEEFEARDKGEMAFRHAILKGDDAGVRAALAKAKEKHPNEPELLERAARILQMCEGGAVVEGLRARLIVKPLNDKGALALRAPFEDEYMLTLRLTNVGDKRIQLAFSSYPIYYFCKLKICPVGPDGKPGEALNAYFDLYPLSDMAMPERVFVSVAPGAWVERPMNLLLNEGFLMQTIREHRLNVELPKAKNFGALRTPGVYELSASYQIEPKDLDGDAPLFERSLDRRESEPLWKGPKVFTPPLRLEILAGKDPEHEPPAPIELKR